MRQHASKILGQIVCIVKSKRFLKKKKKKNRNIKETRKIRLLLPLLTSRCGGELKYINGRNHSS